MSEARELRNLRIEKMAIHAAILAYAFSDVEDPEWANQQREDLNRVCARIKELEREKPSPSPNEARP